MKIQKLYANDMIVSVGYKNLNVPHENVYGYIDLIIFSSDENIIDAINAHMKKYMHIPFKIVNIERIMPDGTKYKIL